MANNKQLKLSHHTIERARTRYHSYIYSCMAKDGQFRLTHYSEITPYGLCFAIFGLHLLKQNKELLSNADRFEEKLKSNLFTYKKERESVTELALDKPFLQLLTFTLSALHILGCIEKDPLEELLLPLVSRDIATDLRQIGALNGAVQSGNMAMYKAILLIHGRDYLGKDNQNQIDTWVELHLKSMNKFGFWGKNRNLTHLQFQNGYHQYEIFDYLGAQNPKRQVAAEHLFSLADPEGHFAPYPGGSGCYDYDAICILTGLGRLLTPEQLDILLKSANTILRGQNTDGGFAESHRIRPRSIRNTITGLRHVTAARGQLRLERLRYILTLMRPKHDRIHTHWSIYSRRWDESNLWDSWFRMLSVARIQAYLDPNAINRWGFISYPGIGFHHLLRNRANQEKEYDQTQ